MRIGVRRLLILAFLPLAGCGLIFDDFHESSVAEPEVVRDVQVQQTTVAASDSAPAQRSKTWTDEQIQAFVKQHRSEVVFELSGAILWHEYRAEPLGGGIWRITKRAL